MKLEELECFLEVAKQGNMTVASKALHLAQSTVSERVQQLEANLGVSLFERSARDRRLALEVGVIQALAESLVHRLERHDPLSERVHHRKVEAAGLALRGGLGVALRRLRRMAGSHQPRLRGSRR